MAVKSMIGKKEVVESKLKKSKLQYVMSENMTDSSTVVKNRESLKKRCLAL